MAISSTAGPSSKPFKRYRRLAPEVLHFCPLLSNRKMLWLLSSSQVDSQQQCMKMTLLAFWLSVKVNFTLDTVMLGSKKKRARLINCQFTMQKDTEDPTALARLGSLLLAFQWLKVLDQIISGSEYPLLAMQWLRHCQSQRKMSTIVLRTSSAVGNAICNSWARVFSCIGVGSIQSACELNKQMLKTFKSSRLTFQSSWWFQSIEKYNYP